MRRLAAAARPELALRKRFCAQACGSCRSTVWAMDYFKKPL